MRIRDATATTTKPAAAKRTLRSRLQYLLGSVAGQSWRMAVMSLISLGLGYLLTLLFLQLLAVPAASAYLYATVICSIVNFFGCRHWVFQGARAPLLSEALKFFPSILAFRLVESLAFSWALRWLGNHHLAYLLTAFTAVCLKYVLFRSFVFSRK